MSGEREWRPLEEIVAFMPEELDLSKPLSTAAAERGAPPKAKPDPPAPVPPKAKPDPPLEPASSSRPACCSAFPRL